MKEIIASIFGMVVGCVLVLLVSYYQDKANPATPADPNKPKETILHYHVLDKSMCKWPS